MYGSPESPDTLWGSQARLPAAVWEMSTHFPLPRESGGDRVSMDVYKILSEFWSL